MRWRPLRVSRRLAQLSRAVGQPRSFWFPAGCMVSTRSAALVGAGASGPSSHYLLGMDPAKREFLYGDSDPVWATARRLLDSGMDPELVMAELHSAIELVCLRLGRHPVSTDRP